MEELYLGQRAVMMASAIRRFLERVGMDNRDSMLDMDVRKKRYTAEVRYKKYRQEPLY